MTNMNQDYFKELADRINNVFAEFSNLYNHFEEFPWLVGALGDPFSRIMFIGENPSLRQVQRAKSRRFTSATPDAQWNTSKGDQIFREALFLNGFKSTPPGVPGGWNCYITNVIKEADYALRIASKKQIDRNNSAETWFDVLKWELSMCKPKLVVTMGKQTQILLDHLRYKYKLFLPQTINITHYAYIGQGFDTVQNLIAGDPKRIEQYQAQIAFVRQVFDKQK